MEVSIRPSMFTRLSTFAVIVSSLALSSTATLAFQGNLQAACDNGQRSATTLFSTPSGPKAAGRRRTPRSSTSKSTGPRSDRPARRRERPASAPATFDAKVLTMAQDSSEATATPLDLSSVIGGPDSTLRCMTENMVWTDTALVSSQPPPFEFLSLDDLFGSELGFSGKFNSDKNFREKLRMAIRQDIFDTTPFYSNLSEKAASVLLLPDSSLEGSWRNPTGANDSGDDGGGDGIRMKLTTQVLQHAFASKLEADNGIKIPTGDELMHSIGGLCGPKPSTHWIDIYGVQDRAIPHSWHQDFGRSPENSMTVLWGFPPESNYEGCGVFTHLAPLARECLAPTTHPREPVLFAGKIDEQHIIRPSFGPGRELLRYRDIDVLHSAPDVTYRASVMRFM